MNEKVGRNDPCPCGSGKKYKSCCLLKEKPKYSMGKRVFTAKVISGGGAAQQSAQAALPGNIKPPEYSTLMERSYGDVFKEDNTPPVSPGFKAYLPKKEG